MIVLGLDPGPTTSGYAILDFRSNKSRVVEHGIATWDEIVIILDWDAITHVGCEAIIAAHGKKQVINKHLVSTCIGIGRVLQACKTQGKEFKLMRRQSIIKIISGKGPTKDHKPSKADMQVYLQQILGLEKVIRPQHANDAACAGVAIYKPPVTEAENGSGKNSKKNKRRKSTT